MNSQVFKTILIGSALGAALFFIPFFLFKVFVFFILVGLAFRFFGRHRYYRGPAGWAYADKIRHMSDDEYQQFKDRWSSGSGRCGHRSGTDVTPSEDEKA